MAELTGTTTTPVSDVMLARYVAGDLSGEQLARVERALGETPGLAERLERMKSERNAFLAALPAERFAHQVATRLTVERPTQPKWHIWWLLPPVTVATALLFGVVYQRALGPQSLSRPAVTTDEAFELPEEATAPRPVTPSPELRDDGAAQPIADQAPARDLPIKAEAPIARDPAATNKGGTAGLAGVDADKQALSRREDRERARKKDMAPLGDLASDGLGQQAFGTGRGGAAPGREANGYAQPPSGASTRPAEPVSPPVWAAPPPPAPAAVEKQSERRSQAAVSSAEESERLDGDAAVGSKVPAAPRAAAPSAGPLADAEAPKVAKESAAAKPADAKAKSAPAASVGSATSEDDRAPVPPTSASISREVGGRTRVITAGEVVPSASLIKVTAQGGRYVTVIGVRRDGVAHVYGQMESPSSQAVVVPVRLRPAGSRIAEALFVVVGDAPLGKPEVSSIKDAAQLPLRLAVAGTQRRFVVTVSASAD